MKYPALSINKHAIEQIHTIYSQVCYKQAKDLSLWKYSDLVSILN